MNGTLLFTIEEEEKKLYSEREDDFKD